jgi:ABC-type transport system involved in multi-copper enzyme maturation permease subunit
MSFSGSFLLADIFDRFRLQLSEGIVNALTPLWMLCVGVAAGIVLCAAIWAILRAVGLIPGIGALVERRESRYVAIAIVTLGLFVAALFTVGPLRPGAAPAAQGADAAAPAAEPQGAIGRLLTQPWELAGYLVASLFLAGAIVTLLRPSALAETSIAIREGVLWPLTVTAIVMAVLALLGMFVVRRPMSFLDSLVRAPVLARQGELVTQHEIAPAPNQFDEPTEVTIPVSFRKAEIRDLRVVSDQRVKVRTESFDQQSPVAVTVDVPAGQEKSWRRVVAGVNPFREDIVTKLFVKNYGSQPAHLTLTTVSVVAHPQMMLVPWVAMAVAGIFFVYLFQRAATPKLAAIALSTAKSEIAQPLYAIIMAMGIFGLVIFVFIPYFTLSGDIKMLKDSGLSLILVLCIMQAVWAASSSVADEVDGKTALTVLSKPVSRRDFILGKFSGIGWAVGLMLIMLGLLLMVVVAYKPIYDAREGGYTLTPEQMAQFQTDPNWQNCYSEMVQIVPGLVLAFLETLVMAALSVAISTRLPFLANVVISFSIYVLGHLTPLLVQSNDVAEQLPPVVFFGRLIATVIPVLDHFNVQASVAAGVPVPLTYLSWALVYCTLYSAVAMLLALTLFEDRDLA